MSRQCYLIGLTHSSYYRSCSPQVSKKNLSLMTIIDEEYTRHPFLGSRKMRDTLRRQGHIVNRKRVQRLMRTLGLSSVLPKPNTSQKHKAHHIYEYLLRDVTVDRVDQVWSSDITYLRLKGGFAYLVAVMDWHSRRVLSWELSSSMDSHFCISALESAIRLHGQPEIFNTDQGSQFTSEGFTGVLKASDIAISMDGKGRWADNVFVERLWRSVKYEEVYLNEYGSIDELRKALKVYFDYYNYERPHQSLCGLTPAEVYTGLTDSKKAA